MPNDEKPIWTSRGYLPHYHGRGSLQSITYRLAGALPRHVAETISQQLENTPSDERERLRREHIEAYLDAQCAEASRGSAVLARAACAEIVVDNWLHFDGIRYRLLAWVVMPNHVHVLIDLIDGWHLEQIVHGWKSYTAKKILNHLGEDALKPPLWQREYWDRFIRDEAHHASVVEYIHRNPVKAGLVDVPEDWPFSSASCRN